MGAVSDHERKRSAALANGYVEELHNLTRRLAFTEAGQRRVFFQRQLEDEKQELSTAELALKSAQERTGLIQLDAQGKAIIETIAKMRAEIAVREVALRTASSFSTDQNPEVIRRREELAAMREQLAKLERASDAGNDDIQVPPGKVPEAALEYMRRLRDVRYHEALFEFLSKQLEAARIDEAKDSVVVQVIDTAVEPESKSGPKRARIVMSVALVSLLVSAMLVLLQDRLGRGHSGSEIHQKLQRLRAEVHF